MSSWECPFCGRLAVYDKIQKKNNGFVFDADTVHGAIHFRTWVNACPNPDCKEYTVLLDVNKAKQNPNGGYTLGEEVESWLMRPQAAVKTYPEFIPKAIRSDYKEAALIKNLSPKASATLSRRCLQGMIRDFWGVKEKNLYEEIKAIEDKVDSETWHAIDAIRNIGNIGAHMEKDIDVIIDVDSDEAGLLINLIETLLSDWYVERENRRLRSQKIVDAAEAKRELKQQK
ncbi:TPA: DUF4145 domain-containing protein [Citrobacter amalonaticus]